MNPARIEYLEESGRPQDRKARKKPPAKPSLKEIVRAKLAEPKLDRRYKPPAPPMMPLKLSEHWDEIGSFGIEGYEKRNGCWTLYWRCDHGTQAIVRDVTFKAFQAAYNRVHAELTNLRIMRRATAERRTKPAAAPANARSQSGIPVASSTSRKSPSVFAGRPPSVETLRRRA